MIGIGIQHFLQLVDQIVEQEAGIYQERHSLKIITKMKDLLFLHAELLDIVAESPKEHLQANYIWTIIGSIALLQALLQNLVKLWL